MAIPDETAAKGEPETPWGTWEELLLTCAVHRYGTKSWDSVAIEIQKRSSASSTLHNLLTPHHCKQKYHDLKRRYTPQNDGVSPPTNNDDKAETVPWLEDLRKLRVAELKLELERYDLSIVSLQSKVKRLEEEREESLREGENGGEKSDLDKTVEREKEEEEKREERSEPDKSSPELVAGEESDRNNNEPDQVQTGDVEPDGPGISGGSSKPIGENSCNGSSDSIEKEPVQESVKAEPEGAVSDSPGLLESVAESKGAGGEESSDVQSSASRSRKEGGSDKVRSGCNSGDEPENEDQSPAVKRNSDKSLPLVDFIEIVRSHKLGSVFERRVESQETTPKYRNLIRQHIDLETMQTRLEEGWYSGCHIKFFRDLLLLLNNAVLFFGKKSRESAAVIELRKLISKEMNQRSLKLDSSSEEPPPLPPAPLSSKPEPEVSDSLLLKPKISGPIIVCRTRSSVAAKATGSSSAADRKREQKAALLEEKPILDWKQPNKSSGNAEEPRITKKRTRDGFASGSRSSNKNGTSRTNASPNKNSEAARSSQNQGKGASSSEHSEPKSENNTMSGAKKRSAANFLNRMKRSSSTNNGSLPDTVKSSAISSNNNNNKGGAEQRRSGNGKADGRKEQASRRGSGGRQAKEQQGKEQQGNAAKRNIGRPPKRAAAPPPSTPATVSGKRSREGGDTETSRKPKKRSRR